MEIKQVFENKKQYMDLLFLADEQEDMIDKYLDRVENFFVDNYDHLMFEDGIQLVDMVYLKREF